MIEARFRRRASAEDKIDSLHASDVEFLNGISWLWKSDPVNAALVTQGESAACDLTPFSRVGVACAISYSARFVGGMQDKAIFDDTLTVRMDEAVLSYKEFCPNVFSEMVVRFCPYRASIIHDIEGDVEDYEKIIDLSQRFGIDVDGRDTVFRFNPVEYFDQQLCRRSFQLDACQVVERIKGHVYDASILNEGVLIVVTRELINQSEVKKYHEHLANLLFVDRKTSA